MCFSYKSFTLKFFLPVINMDPLCAWIIIEYKENSVSKTHYQCGVFVTPIVITVANRLFIEDPNSTDKYKIKNITVQVRNERGTFFKEAIDWTVFHSQDVKDALESSFQLTDSDDGDKLSRVEHLSYFVVMRVHTMFISQTQYCNVERGMEVLVSFPPYVERRSIIAGSPGIISSVMGRNNELFLTDVQISRVGSPVCRDFRDSHGGGYRMLSGMIIKQLPSYSNGVLSGSSGFQLGVSIHPLLQSLDLHLGGGEYLRPNLTPATSIAIPHNQMRTDFSVIIENGPGKGTGIIIHEDGFILTNAHVVKFMENIEVTVKFNDVGYTATVLFTSKSSHLDIALLHISEGSKFPSCKMSEERHFRGEVVYAVGHGALLGRFTSFISKGNIVDSIGNSTLTTCLTLHGSSGGAILNKHGEVIGLLTGMYTLPGTKKALLSSCIPVHLFKKIIEQFLETRDFNRLNMLTAYERQIAKL